ncbi:alkaline phosphatase family protein [Reichenbachiella sp.]
MRILHYTTFLAILLLVCSSCTSDSEDSNLLTKNVFVIVIDGARFSETWGEENKSYIPNIESKFTSDGVVYKHFYNQGPTYTNAGHTAITTGNYQEIANNGSELPQNPSLFQYWLAQSNSPKETAWVIASKDKLEVLNNCKDSLWNGKYQASTNCGVDGLGSGYRHDTITQKIIFEVLEMHHPSLVLINFREPDFSGHKNDWNGYINGIRSTDQMTMDIIDFIEKDPLYSESTAVFITNDHGRHLDSVKNGFVSHGDDCEGCRHMMFFAYGPDFKKGIIEETTREMIDIPATIAHLLQIDMPTGKGQLMDELFIND